MMPTPSPRKADQRSFPAFLAPLFPLLYILGFRRSLPFEGSQENQEPHSEIAVPLNLDILPATPAKARGAFLSGLKADESCGPGDGPQQELTVSEIGGAPLSFGPLVDLSGRIGSKLPEVAAAVNSVSAPVEMGTK
jgi:hypothetical protein